MAQVYRAAAIQAAQIAGRSSEMDAAAERVASAAREIAASHRVTGEFVDSIATSETRGKRGVTDRIASVDHEAAASIEFGHRTRGGRGYVEGLHIMGRAAGLR